MDQRVQEVLSLLTFHGSQGRENSKDSAPGCQHCICLFLCMCARICVKGADASDPIPRTPAEIRKATSARQKENHIQELTHQRKDVSGSTLAQRAEGTSALAQPYGPLTIPGMGRGAAGQCSVRLSRPFLLSPLSLPRRLLASAYYECPAFWSG